MDWRRILLGVTTANPDNDVLYDALNRRVSVSCGRCGMWTCISVDAVFERSEVPFMYSLGWSYTAAHHWICTACAVADGAYRKLLQAASVARDGDT